MSKRIKTTRFIAYTFDSDARLVGCEEVSKLDLAAAAIVIGIRQPVPERAVVAQRLREIAARMEGVAR